MAASSQVGDICPQVFINYRKDELRRTIIPRLLPALRCARINFFIDDNLEKGRPIDDLLTIIEESKMALVFFSKRYPESEYCLDELQKIKELMKVDRLKVIPVFVNVTTSDVKNFNGVFGRKFNEMRKKYAHDPAKVQKWKEALECISEVSGVVWNDERPFGRPLYAQPCLSTDRYVVNETVKAVKKQLFRMYGRDPNPMDRKDRAFSNFLMAALAGGCGGIFIPNMFFTDKQLLKVAFWLVAIPVFFIVFQKIDVDEKTAQPVTTPPAPPS